MERPLYIVVGRSDDCDLVLTHPSVSGRHARLCWRGRQILVEDLGSANGTYVDGERVSRAEARPGSEVAFGHATLDWTDGRLKAFLRRGARGDTLIGERIPGRRFLCGSCGARGVMPPGFSAGRLRCATCGVRLEVGRGSRARTLLAALAAAAATVAVALGVVLWRDGASADAVRRAAERLVGDRSGAPAASAEERSIQRSVAPAIAAAIDVSSPATRNASVRIAAQDEGPFRVEQVARIWSHVRAHWRYVNDPHGDEYFAPASQTIENGYAGDCDDFAIVLASMVEAIGGEARVVMLDGDQGGHAYAEACIKGEPQEVAQRLSVHYQRNWDRYLGRQELENIHFRSSPECPVWLNLDWNARVPGGPYGRELWAVAIYPTGRTETLAPAGGDDAPRPEEPGSRVRASALPP